MTRKATHDGMFTKDNPVLPKQSTELAKGQARHQDTRTKASLGGERYKSARRAPRPPDLSNPPELVHWAVSNNSKVASLFMKSNHTRSRETTGVSSG